MAYNPGGRWVSVACGSSSNPTINNQAIELSMQGLRGCLLWLEPAVSQMGSQ